ncbi:MAG: hypothetical protein K6T81_02045 [Alicyclobacillus macrosporangiidus]|uniref:hypothetical protein n=1 Tax=Alicyclobacillus macrosporangiidus TaxID=392015 RepID=UPI0026EA40A7|nr:hypothetical protein [Alicyclobacillus macrosporangiidus]MCL6597504.1 hypothetical protein [Alicyclobacillus macrosporangiidus]
MRDQMPMPMLLHLHPETVTLDTTEQPSYRYDIKRQLNVLIDSNVPAISLMGTKTLTDTIEPTDDDEQLTSKRMLGTETFTKTFEAPDSDVDAFNWIGTRIRTYAQAEPLASNDL